MTYNVTNAAIQEICTENIQALVSNLHFTIEPMKEKTAKRGPFLASSCLFPNATNQLHLTAHGGEKARGTIQTCSIHPFHFTDRFGFEGIL